MKSLFWILVGFVLGEILAPVLRPVLEPVGPTVGAFIQSIIVSQTEASQTVAIRYAAAGYRDAADVLLTLVGLLMVAGVIPLVFGLLARLPRPFAPGWKGYVSMPLVVLGAIGFGYVTYRLSSELGARTNAMNMYKFYQRKMAVLAPYLSAQEGREIHSHWSLMDGTDDLRNLDQRLIALMEQHDVLHGSRPGPTPDR
jgi:hypothetical protein